MSLSAQLLDWHGNPACPDLADCLPFDDPRLAYGGPDGRPTVVDYGAAPLPAAVINLDPSNLGCLVGVSVLRQPAATCLDLTGAQAPIVQAAHAPVTPALPPAVTATAVPAAGAGVWDNQPVSATIVATDQGSGVASVSYRADGAQVITATIVPGTQAVVTLAAEGVTRPSRSSWTSPRRRSVAPPPTACGTRPTSLWLAAPSMPSRDWRIHRQPRSSSGPASPPEPRPRAPPRAAASSAIWPGTAPPRGRSRTTRSIVRRRT